MANIPMNVPSESPANSESGAGVPLREKWIFNDIPTLKQLLPEYAGWPGFYYAQVPTHLARLAQDAGWRRLNDDKVYTIVGPDGRADMQLLVQGSVVPGQSPHCGERLCKIDKSVAVLTGHTIPELGKAGEELEPMDIAAVEETTHGKARPAKTRSKAIQPAAGNP